MSFMDFDSMAPAGLIAQYVLDVRGKAFFLAYQEYEIIDEWLALAKDADELLLVLSDILPGRVAAGMPAQLTGIRKLVLKALKDLRMRDQSRETYA